MAMTKNPKKISKEEMQERLERLDDWEIDGDKQISKSYSFDNFRQALDFTQKVGMVAEDIQHHPEIFLTWGKVEITIKTHQTGNLTESDFDLAEEIDKLDD